MLKHLRLRSLFILFCFLMLAVMPASAAEIETEAPAATVETEAPAVAIQPRKRGLIKEDGAYYYYRKNAPITSRWKKVKGKKYYFGADGKAYTGYHKINGKGYFFSKRGQLQYKTLVKGKKLYRINPTTGEVLKVINRNSKMICLTFDDGPWGASTDSVISTLRSYNVAATFFIVGTNTQYYGSKLKSEYALGCDIANHTYSHLVANSGTAVSTFVNEIQKCNQALANYGIPAAKYLRAPGGGVMAGGSYNSATEAAARQLGLPVFYWSKMSNDCAGASVSAIISNCTSNLSDGHIVLMHDSYSTTAQALPSILTILKQQGYEPVTLTEFSLCRKIKYRAGSLYSRYDSGSKRLMKYSGLGWVAE